MCVLNYRPISLLSIVSKDAERYVYNHIIVLGGDIHALQHGFLEGRSTVTQLAQSCIVLHCSQTIVKHLNRLEVKTIVVIFKKILITFIIGLKSG